MDTWERRVYFSVVVPEEEQIQAEEEVSRKRRGRRRKRAKADLLAEMEEGIAEKAKKTKRTKRTRKKKALSKGKKKARKLF